MDASLLRNRFAEINGNAPNVEYSFSLRVEARPAAVFEALTDDAALEYMEQNLVSHVVLEELPNGGHVCEKTYRVSGGRRGAVVRCRTVDREQDEMLATYAEGPSGAMLNSWRVAFVNGGTELLWEMVGRFNFWGRRYLSTRSRVGRKTREASMQRLRDYLNEVAATRTG